MFYQISQGCASLFAEKLVFDHEIMHIPSSRGPKDQRPDRRGCPPCVDGSGGASRGFTNLGKLPSIGLPRPTALPPPPSSPAPPRRHGAVARRPRHAPA